MADPHPRDPAADRPVDDSPAGERFRPPGPHHVVDPEDVSQTPVLSPNAHEVSDAEAELLVTDAAEAGPAWSSSRLIAGTIGLILILLTVALGAWLFGWLNDEGDEALNPALLVAPPTVASVAPQAAAPVSD
ncbi:hypothetical protein [Alienimonas sp. DA493]|uniref:hypothetical protein n=1 Tax=Alienimonas sp. DA493 TaxID=3373605 RepID=UPI003754517B